MAHIGELRSGSLTPGLYMLAGDISADIAAQLADGVPGSAFVQVDGSTIRSKRDFLAAFSAALLFPDPVDDNWDAFFDWSRDLDWFPATSYTILYDCFEVFAAAQPDQFAIGLEILTDTADYWQSQAVPMYIVLHRCDADVTPPPNEDVTILDV